MACPLTALFSRYRSSARAKPRTSLRIGTAWAIDLGARCGCDSLHSEGRRRSRRPEACGRATTTSRGRPRKRAASSGPGRSQKSPVSDLTGFACAARAPASNQLARYAALSGTKAPQRTNMRPAGWYLQRLLVDVPERLKGLAGLRIQHRRLAIRGLKKRCQPRLEELAIAR